MQYNFTIEGNESTTSTFMRHQKRHLIGESLGNSLTVSAYRRLANMVSSAPAIEY